MALSESIARLRRGRGWSQERLAGEIGVSRQAVSKWESGQAVPDLEKLVALGEVFAVSLDELVKASADGTAEARAEGASPAGGRAETAADGAETVESGGYRPWRRRYEYRSRRTLGGLPLVHIHVGAGLCRARGVVAVGNIATGVVAVGGVAAGAVAAGGLSVGLVALAGLAAGAVAVGGLALGVFAVGGVAAGVLAVGGAAFGKYAVGGAAIASDVAIGGFARGRVAVGRSAQGVRVLLSHAADGRGFSDLRAADVAAAIRDEFPRIPRALASFLTALFSS